MKGIIFNLAEAVVGKVYGEDTWDAILDRAGLDGSWTSLGSYPDEELLKVVAAAAELLGLSRQSLYVKLRRYGIGDVDLEETAAG